MRLRRLGASDLNVSEISLGSWLTYGVGVEASKAEACLNEAFTQGVNFLDTSNIYGCGAAETFLGKALAGRRRDSYILATKLFFPMSDTDFGLSRGQIKKQLDDSLRRLNTDHVDLYQCHRYDEDTPLDETLEALTAAVKAGKARWLGFSEWTAPQIRSAAQLPNVARFVSSQPQYSILWREPEAEVFPACAESGASQIVWSPLAQGLLTGKYKKGAPIPPDSRAASPEMGGFMGRWLQPGLLDAVERLRPIAAQCGLSLPQLALAWVLRRPEVASAIIGASRPEQVVENCKASGKTLAPDVLKAIDAAVSGALRS